MQNRIKTLPKSIHFSLEQVSDGVYAALSSNEGGAVSNAGIIDLGDRTVVFDTFETPKAAEDLRVATEILTGRQATWVVNSHAHQDHWFGNQVFDQDTIVLASHPAWERMVGRKEEIDEEKSDPTELEEFLQSQESQLQFVSDQRKRLAIKSTIARWQFYLQSLPNLQPRIPDQTFEGRIELHGSIRKVELIQAGAAHTRGDCYLTLPDEKIVFIGDIGFFDQLPYMADCDPKGWRLMLDELNNSEYEIFIPGHGPIGGKKQLKLIDKYITMLEKMVSKALVHGRSADDVLELELPEPFRTWSISSARMEVNTQFMFENLSSGG